jgi:hypothetical protein
MTRFLETLCLTLLGLLVVALETTYEILHWLVVTPARALLESLKSQSGEPGEVDSWLN